MANRTQLEKEIKEYCNLNNINDVPGFITQCMLRGFNIFRFGMSPGDNIKRQNGIIVDNGSNRTQNKKQDNVKEIEVVEPKTKENGVTTEDKAVVSQEPVVVKRKRKIMISNV